MKIFKPLHAGDANLYILSDAESVCASVDHMRPSMLIKTDRRTIEKQNMPRGLLNQQNTEIKRHSGTMRSLTLKSQGARAIGLN